MTTRTAATRISPLIAGVFLLLLIPLFLTVPANLRQDPLIGPLADRYHVGLFLILTILLYRHGPLAGRPWAVIAFALVLGGVTELLQLLAGRSAMVWDWYQDALGVGLGACWIWWRRRGRLVGPLLTVLALIALVAWPLRHLPLVAAEGRAAVARFPVLDDFERPRSTVLWYGHDEGHVVRRSVPGQGNVLELASHGESPWPGAVSRKLPWDWSGMTTFRFTCRLQPPSPQTMRLSVWLEDRANARDSDYAMAFFEVDHTWQTFEVSLPDLRTRRRDRSLALHEIQGLAIYLRRREPGSIVLQLDDIELDGS